ncbi:hypothetical protein [Enterococcus sp. DIV0240a]|uniref:hypothetical protein n=1 Tax=Enterococcus sp. DIV0240a TaxID=2774651 RepID=UPI003D28770C
MLDDILNALSNKAGERKSGDLSTLDKLAREQAESVKKRREAIKQIAKEKYNKQ